MTATKNLIKEGHLIEDMYANMGITQIPYQSSLSFRPLIRELEKKAQEKNSGTAMLSELIVSQVKEHPLFSQPIPDPNLIEDNCEVFDLLISSVLPTVFREQALAKLAAPFNFNAVYVTPGLKKLLHSEQVKVFKTKIPESELACTMIVGACSLILNQFYGQNLEVTPQISFYSQDTQTNRVIHYKFNMVFDFVEIKKLQPLQPLSQEQINELLSNIYDTDLWLKYLPPANFAFEGFVIGHLTDITAEQTLSSLNYLLLQKNAVLYRENIVELEHLVRNHFHIPDLRLGLTAIDYPVEKSVAHRYKIRFDFLADQHKLLLSDQNKNSIYEKVCKYREVLLIEDLASLEQKTPVEEDLLKKGIRSIIVAPLFNKDGRVIGILELGAPSPYQLNSFVEVKFKELISLFSLAVERSRDEVDNQIEAVIREQFTAVHPSVEWRFIEASYNLLEKRESDSTKASMEPIIFEGVYPLYGQADIVSSSNKRNAAIQADLTDNLQRAQHLLKQSLKNVRFPLAGQALMKIEQGLQNIHIEFSSSDESQLVELLQNEIHPILEYIQQRFPDMTPTISNYFDYLDEDLGIVYKQRKDYEDSVAMINNTISNYIEEQQKEAQQILPHYFEKYKTDGVEYDIYVGQSLLKRDLFSDMHLKNLRLWQLVNMCEITRIVEGMQSELPVPLTTAQLIFAYNTQLSIRFRMDEKQFDVDGAYNVRYEILKKRIDKAVIEGTDERLTVAGKIAIVYLQDKDRQEYFEYFKYLQHEGLISSEVEDLTLGKLQGVQGLRALRVSVIH
jgi:HPt (histidine-containing phosphotransfer) domain-containing protein